MRQKIKKYFTLEQANQSLALISPIVTDMLAEFKYVSALRMDQESEEFKATITKSIDKVIHCKTDLDNLGVIVVDFQRGIIDFHVADSSQELYFCWKHNEPEVCFFHGPECVISQRQHIYTLTNFK